MRSWGWHFEWLFTWRAVLILGLPLLWCIVATLIGRRIEGRR